MSAVSESAAKDELAATVNKGNETLASETATTEDVETATADIVAQLRIAKLETAPVKGQSYDMTEFLTNPSFESQTTGWTLDKKASGWEAYGTWSDRPAADGTYFVSVVNEKISSLDLHQEVDGLPAGRYTVTGALRNTDGVDKLTDQHVYAQAGSQTVDSDPLTNVSGDDNNDWSTLPMVKRFASVSVQPVTATAQKDGSRPIISSSPTGDLTLLWTKKTKHSLSSPRICR